MIDNLFSILVPAYKSAYLRECIDSIMVQTYKNFELIIVDDASPENLKAIVDKYDDSRIRYYRNETNVGAVDVVDNWNKCLGYATGDYVICMGDDDRLLPNCIEEYDKLITKYPGLGVYHAWTEIIDENSEFLDVSSARPEFESAYSLIWHRMDHRNKQYVGDFLFNKKKLIRNGGFYKLPLAWGSDDISAVIAAIPYGVANTQIVTFQYRKSPLTLSSTGNVEVKVKALMKQEKWYKDFLQKKTDNEQDEKFRIKIADIYVSYFEKQIASKISVDVNNNLFHIFKWIAKRREYGFDNKVLIYVFKSFLRNIVI